MGGCEVERCPCCDSWRGKEPLCGRLGCLMLWIEDLASGGAPLRAPPCARGATPGSHLPTLGQTA